MTSFGAVAAGTAATALTAAALHYRGRVRGPFEPTTFVWSRGLALLCDKNGGTQNVKRQRGSREALPLDPRTYSGVEEGELVWVRVSALPRFVDAILPNIRRRFTLVTGDEDWSMPSGFSGSERILSNPLVLHWFAQNFDGTDESGRISGIPIGLDFHTISNRHRWKHWPATPAMQEARLEELVSRVKPTRARIPRVHADFHFKDPARKFLGETRRDVEATLRRNGLVDFQERKRQRQRAWESRSEYAFVASPPGNGLDCHRTWESLVLGNIVIVRHSSLDPLFEGLPVALIDDWAEITEENLVLWMEQFGPLFGRADVRERLTNRYWIDRMRRRTAQALG